MFFPQWHFLICINLDNYWALRESSDWCHKMPYMFVNFEGLENNLYFLCWKDGIFYWFEIIDFERLFKTMTDYIIIWKLRSFFSLYNDFIFSVKKLIVFHEAVYTLIETFHSFLESVEEGIKILDNEILLNGVVEHVRSCPIDIKIGVFNKVIIKKANKVTRML